MLIEEVQQREKIELRQTLQLNIVDALRGLWDAHQVAATAFQLLREYLQVSCINYAEFNEINGIFRVQHAWQQKGLPSLASIISGFVEVGFEGMTSLRKGNVATFQYTHAETRTARYPFYGRL